jgi:hypothetical protein
VAQCVVIDGTGAIVATSDPVASCTGYLLATPTEFASMQSLLGELSAGDGAIIGSYILAACAVAWGFRLMGKLVWQSTPQVEGDE